MPSRSIRLVGDPILQQPAGLVTEFDGRLQRLVTDLRDTLRNQPALAVAAPQVGVSQSVFVYYDHPGTADRHTSVLVNPVLASSEDHWMFNEGCLSFPGLFFEIERWRHVVVEGFDAHGGSVTVRGSDLLGRVLQHEIDHLAGTLFSDLLNEEQRARLQDWSDPDVRPLRKGLKTLTFSHPG